MAKQISLKIFTFYKCFSRELQLGVIGVPSALTDVISSQTWIRKMPTFQTASYSPIKFNLTQHLKNSKAVSCWILSYLHGLLVVIGEL